MIGTVINVACTYVVKMMIYHENNHTNAQFIARIGRSWRLWDPKRTSKESSSDLDPITGRAGFEKNSSDCAPAEP